MWRKWRDGGGLGWLSHLSHLAKSWLLSGGGVQDTELCSSLFRVAILFAFLVYMGILAILITGRLVMK